MLVSRGNFMLRWVPIWAFCTLATAPLLAQERALFKGGDLGYDCFRIPALVTWGDGELFAFAEGRRGGCADFGDVDILMRHSTDGGVTWSPAQVVVDNGDLQAGNATPVVDRMDPAHPDGRLLLFYNTGTASEYDTRMGQGRRRGFMTASTDHGATWSTPVDLSPQVHMDRHSARPEVDARTLAFAPGHALQLQRGPHAGRLFVPANHSLGPPQEDFRDYQTYGAYSDDHGTTWRVSADLGVPSSNEAMAAELDDGTLLLLVRMQNASDRLKRLALSSDGGATWDTSWMAAALTTPVCQSALIHDAVRSTTWHLGPADTATRSQLTLWSSDNGGLHWTRHSVPWPESAAYSDMVLLHHPATGGASRDRKPPTLGVLYERNDYAEIVFDLLKVE